MDDNANKNPISKKGSNKSNVNINNKGESKGIFKNLKQFNSVF